MARYGASELDRLLRAARRLRASAKLASRPWGAAAQRLPTLLFMTDPNRTPAPEAIASRLPRGCGVVFRAFDGFDAVATGRRLHAVARRRGLLLLAGADPALAGAVGAGGVHLPERLAHRAGALRRAHPGWVVTAAAHNGRAIVRAARFGAHAVLVSPVFESLSPSAGRPLTALKFAALARLAKLPVYALGGVDEKTAPRLLGSGAVGVAAVGAIART